MSAAFNTLTSKQKKVYTAIETFIKSKGIPPTVREIGEILGEKTPGAVQGILNRLEQKGVIKREMGMARSIQLVSGDTLYETPVYIPEIKKISVRNTTDLMNVYNVSKFQAFPKDFAGDASNSFLIKCPDNSLYGDGIKYDDILLVRQYSELTDGDIVVILYENHVLLRYFHTNKKPGYITLKAGGNLIGKEEFETSEITIIGKVVGKYTKY